MDPDDTGGHPVDDGDDRERADDAEEVPVDIETGETDRVGGPTEAVDQRIVDLLSWILDTETRAKIYVHLLANPGSTSEEVARGTGLYPSTVREALAELHDEGNVDREKRASEGAGNNPYEYTAIQPSELVGGVVDQVQNELNTIFALDRILDRGDEDDLEDDVDPVTITVDAVDEESAAGGDDPLRPDSDGKAGATGDDEGGAIGDDDGGIDDDVLGDGDDEE